MSVKRNVTVPPGSAAMMAVSVWSRTSERSRSGSPALEGAHPDLHRDLRRGARHRDRQRRASVDRRRPSLRRAEPAVKVGRSEEHTSELQSLRNLVCRLLLEKKKKKTSNITQSD